MSDINIPQAIEALRAYQAGDHVQIRQIGKGEWRVCPYPAFNLEHFEYRPAPKPREFYVNEYTDRAEGSATRFGQLHNSHAEAEHTARTDEPSCVFKLVEVLAQE